MLSPGMVVADRYELDRELGHGGMGSVWLAHHTQLDTPCAIKFIHAEAANQSEVRARFEREAKAAAQIRSSHVVQILDYGVWGDVPYIAMEYLQGEDLAARLKQRSRLTPGETSSIVTQVGRALTKAHSAGLVHRDLKPENIFLVAEDDQEIAKVLDFGIAKSHEMLLSAGNNTKTGSLLGTPHYMSPEQAQGTKTVDHRSDLWSLAVVTYRCLTGRLPFESDALGDLLLKIIVQPLPIPSSIEGSIPPGFDAWWARATDRDPSGRFQSAREMTESLAVSLGISHLAFPSSLDVSQARGGPMRGYSGSTTPMTHDPAFPMGAAPMQPYPTGHDPLRALSFGPITPGEGPTPIGAQTPGPHPHFAPPSGIQPHSSSPAMPHGASTDSILVSRTLNDAAIPKRKGALVIAGLIGAVMVGGLAAAGFFLTRSSDSADTPAATTEVGSPAAQLEAEDEPPPSVAPSPVPALDSSSAGLASPDPPTSPSEEPPAATAPTPPNAKPPSLPPSKPPPIKPPPFKPPPPSKPPPSKPPVPPPPPGNNWGF